MSATERASADPGGDTAWRDPLATVTQWHGASDVGSADLRFRVRGEFWEVLDRTSVCLLVSHEYEHFVVALAVVDGRPRVSYMPLPHPSGIAFDRRRGVVSIASTRNPNQIFELAPPRAALSRRDFEAPETADLDCLLPQRSHFYPGSMYLHDLAMVGSHLHGNAVGHNAIVRLDGSGVWERVWWPRSIETDGSPDFTRNHLQLNSIGARDRIDRSVFTASGEVPGARKPGHRNYAVDGRGVLFSGRTREPLARGLTRPHSARWHKNEIWLDDSGYGRLAVIRSGSARVVRELPGWTRGLAFAGGCAFVGSSRVLPRFRSYAPGLDVDRSRCAVHVIDPDSGVELGSCEWPEGNQIFAVEPVPLEFSIGFPVQVKARGSAGRLRRLFYSYDSSNRGER